MIIQGSKGSKSPPPPTEVRDTIQLTGEAHIVDLLCEGEIEGLVDQGGTEAEDVRKRKSIFIDEVPLSEEDFPTIKHAVSTHFRNGSFTNVNKIPDMESNLGVAKYANTAVPIPIPSSNRLRKSNPLVISFNSHVYPDIASVLLNIRFPTMLRTYTKEEADEISGYEAGDVREAVVSYSAYLSTNGGSYVRVLSKTVKEKSSGGFIMTDEIPITFDNSQKINYWKLRIERDTEDYDERTTKISAATFLDSVIVRTFYEYIYPNVALNAITFDAKSFPTIPQRAYQLRLLKVKVPNGYTPTKYYVPDGVNVKSQKIVENEAVYPAIWDGTFSSTKVWTDNPAWIYYDLLTNKQYGLGEFVPEEKVDKWTLYQIAKYCDELVLKGEGVPSIEKPLESDPSWLEWSTFHEPRFTANFILNETEEAYNVINNLSSVFRGISYWMGGLIVPVQDTPKSPSYLFTNASVRDGVFNYSSTDVNQRRTVALVRWNDPDNFFRPNVEQVEDTDGVLNFGIRENQIGAFATTSRGQAHRAGKWALAAERLETSIVTFELGFDGYLPRPGQIVSIYDDFRFAKKYGGRVFDMPVFQNQVTLDRIIDYDANLDYKLTLAIPSGYRDASYTGINSEVSISNSSQTGGLVPNFLYTQPITGFQIQSGRHVVYVSGSFPQRYIGGTWTIQASEGSNITGAEPYRILKLEETEEKTIQITALQYSAEKYGLSESGFATSSTQTPSFGNFFIAPPSGLNFETKVDLISGGGAVTATSSIDVTFYRSTGEFVSHHLVSGRRNDINGTTDWEFVGNGPNPENPSVNLATFYPNNVTSGIFEFVVQAVQYGGKLSQQISGSISFVIENPFVQQGNTGVMEPIISLVNPAIGTVDTFETGQFEVKNPIIYFDLLPDSGIATAINDPRYPYMERIEYQFFDKNDNAISSVFSTLWEETIEISPNQGQNPLSSSYISGWPMRNLIIKASGVAYPETKGEIVTKTLINPPPPKSNLVIPVASKDSVLYNIYPLGTLNDFSGIYFWTGENASTISTGFDSPDIISYGLNGEIFTNGATGFVYWAIIDTFSTEDTPINGPVALTVQLVEAHTGWSLDFFSAVYADSNQNEQSVLKMSWSQHQSSSVFGYQVEIDAFDNSYRKRDFISNEGVSGRIYYDIPTPIYDKEYMARVRAVNIYNESSDWSSQELTTGLNPRLVNLNVRGESTFARTTKVEPSGIIINSTTDIDFGQSNIMNITLTNTGSITITPTLNSVREGATYILNITKNGPGEVNWNNFSWPDGEKPFFANGQIGIISALGVSSSGLYAVASTNFL